MTPGLDLGEDGTVKLAIVGTGKIVAEFLSFAPGLDGIELAAIYGRSGAKAMALQRSAGIATAYEDYQECLADPNVDTVYVAVPNQLHYRFSRQALLAGKHVICEKPFTTSLTDFDELRRLAQDRGLVLVEAISNQYQANYRAITPQLPSLGRVKLVQTDYSQYSSRFDDFRRGVVQPAFDPAAGGGALMDIGIYNVHFVVGLFGKPRRSRYTANVERGIDTSGVLVLEYDGFTAVCLGAKDSSSSPRQIIQGDAGTLQMDAAPNGCGPWTISDRAGDRLRVAEPLAPHRMVEEFVAFERMIRERDVVARDRALDHSRIVLQVVLEALDEVGVRLG